ncbi:MAG: hypothetical protein ACYCQI_16595, partial [Gammaproteobacteria bacterium]
MMRKFYPYWHYTIGNDPKIADKKQNLTVTPLQEGRELIAQYYAQKYQTNIEFPHTYYEEHHLKSFHDITDLVLDIKNHLLKARKHSGDYRLAFYIGANKSHATPIIYIKEAGKEGILYADSNGVNEWVVTQMQQNSGIRVFAIKDTRQADFYSCYTDALVFARDTTAIDPKTGKFRIPNLLQRLEDRSVEEKGYYTTKLPDELLKTAQITEFVESHRQAIPTRAHKDEDLTQFRSRYTAEASILTHGKVVTKPISTYLRLKGIKF